MKIGDLLDNHELHIEEMASPEGMHVLMINGLPGNKTMIPMTLDDMENFECKLASLTHALAFYRKAMERRGEAA